MATTCPDSNPHTPRATQAMSQKCCPEQAPSPPNAHSNSVAPPSSSSWRGAPLLSSLGAVIAALLATSCCWLPIALVLLGLSGVGLATRLEAYEPYLMAATAIHLGLGFYWLYLRRGACAPRAHKAVFWAAATFSLALMALPEDLAARLGVRESQAAVHSATPATAAANTPRTTHRYAIEGMTCEGCLTELSAALGEVACVESATLSFPARAATITFKNDARDDKAVIAAIASVGYTARHAPATP